MLKKDQILMKNIMMPLNRLIIVDILPAFTIGNDINGLGRGLNCIHWCKRKTLFNLFFLENNLKSIIFLVFNLWPRWFCIILLSLSDVFWRFRRFYWWKSTNEIECWYESCMRVKNKKSPHFTWRLVFTGGPTCTHYCL